MLPHGLLSFLAFFCCVLSLKEAVKEKSTIAIIGSPLNSICQLSETVVTIGHPAHVLIDKILEKSYNFEWTGDLVTKFYAD